MRANGSALTRSEGAGVSNTTFLPYYLHSPGMAASYILSYLLVLVLCVGGNVMVCLVILANRNMRSVTNLFILNLAVSDLLVGVFCVPTTLIDSLITGWPFSQFTCTMSNLIQGMSVSASVFTLVAIAVDRFLCIVYPFRHRMKPVTALLALLFIWLLAFAIICPSAAMLTVMHLEDTYMVQDNETYPLYVCYEHWPRPGLRRVYTTVIFVQVYLAPLATITLLYGCVVAKLSTNLRQVGLAGSGHARSRRKVKVIKMLIMVATLFMVSWLPLWTLMLLADNRDLDQRQIDLLSGYLFPVAHWLAFSNSGINPVIYGFFNENFRRAFRAGATCGADACHARCANRVSSRGAVPTGFAHKPRGLAGPPQNTPEGIQGILLEDVNCRAPKRVTGAWEE